MKLFGRLVLVLALLSGVAYAKKVKLFDISKYDLKKKETNALETFKVGNIIVKTDLKYHEDNEMYYTGSRIYVYMDNFQGVSFLIKRKTRDSYNGKITFSDDFSEEVSISYAMGSIFINEKEYKVEYRSTLTLKVKEKEIVVFNGKNKLAKLSTAHMNSIVSYEQRCSTHSSVGPERIYKFIIFGENKEIKKNETKK